MQRTKVRNDKISTPVYLHIIKLYIKGCVHYIFASLFLSLKESIVKQGKTFFISLQKLFSFSRKSQVLSFRFTKRLAKM